MWIEANTEGT